MITKKRLDDIAVYSLVLCIINCILVVSGWMPVKYGLPIGILLMLVVALMYKFVLKSQFKEK